MLPILNLEKPKRLTLTMANPLFGALSGVRSMNWGLLIQELVARSIPSIGRKPLYLSPFILHLYQHYKCTTREEDDLITIAVEDINYKLQPVAPDTSTESDHEVSEAHPSPPGSPPPVSRMPNSPPPSSPRHRHHSPDAAGHSLRPPGGMWICPRGSFQKTPFNGCLMT